MSLTYDAKLSDYIAFHVAQVAYSSMAASMRTSASRPPHWRWISWFPSSQRASSSWLPLLLVTFLLLSPYLAASSSRQYASSTATRTSLSLETRRLEDDVPSKFAQKVVGRPSRRRQRRTSIALADGGRIQELLARMNSGTRLALAGALAGGFSNMVLYPIDVAKTLRQAGPASRGASLSSQARIYGLGSLWAGLTPAVLGSMPSSALYFGVYEYVKRRLVAGIRPRTEASSSVSSDGSKELYQRRAQVLRRWTAHALAAAAGNTASSLIFVPKEVLKQQLQMYRNAHGGASLGFPGVFASILREKGVRGLYSGYRATLLRNIPSAVLRFALYEEFKLYLGGQALWGAISLSGPRVAVVAGALAGALSSAATTPLDVIKTRMAINACPPGRDVLGCLLDVAQKEGVPGLYAGVRFRVMYSALFTAVGFSSFEASKALLGVGEAGGEEDAKGSSRH